MDPNIVSLEVEAPDILKTLSGLHTQKIDTELDPIQVETNDTPES